MPVLSVARSTTSTGTKTKSKILQSYQGYSMLVYHKATETYHELIDDTLNALQILDSTVVLKPLDSFQPCSSSDVELSLCVRAIPSV